MRRHNGVHCERYGELCLATPGPERKDGKVTGLATLGDISDAGKRGLGSAKVAFRIQLTWLPPVSSV